MTHIKTDTYLDSKIRNLITARDRWMRVVSMLKERLIFFRNVDKLLPVAVPKDASPAFRRDIESLNAGLHQIEIFNYTIAKLELERTAKI